MMRLLEDDSVECVITPHATMRYREFYPDAERRDIRRSIVASQDIEREIARRLAGRSRVTSGDSTVFLLHPERTGLFVTDPSSGDLVVITFLRFYSLAQHELAVHLYGEGEPVTCVALWAPWEPEAELELEPEPESEPEPEPAPEPPPEERPKPALDITQPLVPGPPVALRDIHISARTRASILPFMAILSNSWRRHARKLLAESVRTYRPDLSAWHLNIDGHEAWLVYSDSKAEGRSGEWHCLPALPEAPPVVEQELAKILRRAGWLVVEPWAHLDSE